MTMDDTSTWRPASVAEAAGVMVSCARFLAGHDYSGTDAATLAELITAMEQVDSGQAVTRGKSLTQFDRAQAYAADGYRATGPWLEYRNGIDRATAKAHRAWMKCLEQHPVVMAAMEGLAMADCIARRICKLTRKFPDEAVDRSDQILVDAWLAGATIPDLADLAARIAAEVMPPDEDDDPGERDGSVRIETTLDGAAVLAGELEPAAAATVQAALERYGAKSGDDDDRSWGQRWHDGLAEICRHVLTCDGGAGGGGKKKRSGIALAHINLADAAKLAGYSQLEQAWVRENAAVWAGQRARATEQAGDGGAWLTGNQADVFLRDAMVTPVVTGRIDPDVIPQLAETGYHLHQLLQDEQTAQPDGRRDARKEELVRDLLTSVIKVVSGPDGYASFIRTRLFEGSPLGGRSLPLDVGHTKDFPEHIRKALGIRDRGCAWSGGCDQPAVRTEPHHVVWRSRGGQTSLDNGGQNCKSHHHYFIHQLGWTVTLNPDGTFSTRRPDGTLYLPRGSPPARAP